MRLIVRGIFTDAPSRLYAVRVDRHRSLDRIPFVWALTIVMIRRLSLSACLVLALIFAAPVSAQRVSTGDRLTALEQQLTSMRSGNLDLLNQVGELKTEVQSLRAQIEELQQQLDQQKQTGRTQYLDLDGRLNRLESGPAPPDALPTPSASIPATVTPSAAIVPPPAVQDTPPRVYGDAATLGKSVDERSAYNTAFDALKAGRYSESARMFQAFLDAHPNGAYGPNAMYWLGESYYVTQNYALAQEQFQNLLDRHATHDKAAGALLKVGLCQYGLRQLDAAEATLGQVLARYPGSEAARTADDRLRAIQLSRVR